MAVSSSVVYERIEANVTEGSGLKFHRTTEVRSLTLRPSAACHIRGLLVVNDTKSA